MFTRRNFVTSSAAVAGAMAGVGAGAGAGAKSAQAQNLVSLSPPVSQVESEFLYFDDPVEEFRAHMRIERDLVPYCQEQQIGIIGYRPMEQGLLTGKMTPERLFDAGDERISQRLFSVENRTAIQKAQAQVQ